jgi:hypothetical protein
MNQHNLLNRQFEYYKDNRTYTINRVRKNKIYAQAGDIIMAIKPKIFESWINQGKVVLK